MTQGLTIKEVCADIGVDEKTLWNWRKKDGPHYDKDFSEAFEQGKLQQLAWWARRGRDNIGEGSDFNTALFTLYMANMFGWRGSASKDDEAMAEIRKVKEALGIEDDV